MLQTIVSVLVHNMVAVLMVAVGLGMTRQGLVETWNHRAVVVRALVTLLVGVPALALLVVTILPLGREVTGFIVLMSVCAGAPLVFRTARNAPSVVVVIAIVSLLAPLTVSASVWLIDQLLGFELSAPISVLAHTALLQVEWLVVGAALAAMFPRRAQLLARIAWWLFLAAFAVALVVVLIKGAPALLTVNAASVLAVLAMVGGSLALGHIAGVPDFDDSRAIATMAVLGNPALAIAVIAASYPGFKPGALFAAYLLARAVALFPYSMWSKRVASRRMRRVAARSVT